MISNEMHLLESQLQQYPTKMKNLKAELVSWQRKEDEWKKKQLEEIEISIGGKEKERQKCSDDEGVLKKERDKRIGLIYDEQRKAEKRERLAVDSETEANGNEISDHRLEMEIKKKELFKLQNDELSGKVTDTSV